MHRRGSKHGCKAKKISKKVTEGVEKAPMRSLFYAMGYTKEELDRPLIGVVSAKSEIVPGHMHLDKVAEAVKAGVRMAGGTPIEVPSIGVCDGIAMGHEGMKYSLASRELIADSVETMAVAHCFDGLVLVPNCDKIVPGMIMAAVRLDILAGFLSTLWDRIRVKGLSPTRDMSVRPAAEHAALMALEASRAGVRTPRLLGIKIGRAHV